MPNEELPFPETGRGSLPLFNRTRPEPDSPETVALTVKVEEPDPGFDPEELPVAPLQPTKNIELRNRMVEMNAFGPDGMEAFLLAIHLSGTHHGADAISIEASRA
jgi:hypothetical protein